MFSMFSLLLLITNLLSTFSEEIFQGEYTKVRYDEEDAPSTPSREKDSSKRLLLRNFRHSLPDITRKDIILMNKLFNRVYGNKYEQFADSKFMNTYPDNNHFNLYYGDEANFFEVSEDNGKHKKKSENLFRNPGFEDPLAGSNWNCLGELNHGSGGIMSRTIKYKRSGKYAGVCHNRIGFWAGPGQFIGHVVMPGRAYKVHGWTKLLNASKEDTHNIELWVRYQGIEVKKSYRNKDHPCKER